jgi:hypothetical protein
MEIPSVHVMDILRYFERNNGLTANQRSGGKNKITATIQSILRTQVEERLKLYDQVYHSTQLLNPYASSQRRGNRQEKGDMRLQDMTLNAMNALFLPPPFIPYYYSYWMVYCEKISTLSTHLLMNQTAQAHNLSESHHYFPVVAFSLYNSNLQLIEKYQLLKQHSILKQESIYFGKSVYFQTPLENIEDGSCLIVEFGIGSSGQGNVIREEDDDDDEDGTSERQPVESIAWTYLPLTPTTLLHNQHNFEMFTYPIKITKKPSSYSSSAFHNVNADIGFRYSKEVMGIDVFDVEEVSLSEKRAEKQREEMESKGEEGDPEVPVSSDVMNETSVSSFTLSDSYFMGDLIVTKFYNPEE